jgi:hypothetical protein
VSCLVWTCIDLCSRAVGTLASASAWTYPFQLLVMTWQLIHFLLQCTAGDSALTKLMLLSTTSVSAAALRAWVMMCTRYVTVCTFVCCPLTSVGTCSNRRHAVLWMVLNCCYRCCVLLCRSLFITCLATASYQHFPFRVSPCIGRWWRVDDEVRQHGR